MILNIKRKFIFRCEKCDTILSADFEDQEDIKDIEEDKIVLECPCGEGHCKLLRD